MYEAISKDKYAIGWGALMHVDGTCVNPDGTKCQPYPNVKILAISATPGWTGGPADRGERAQPHLSAEPRRLHLRQQAAGRPLDPAVREFIRFVLSRQGQQIIDKQGVYSPLPSPTFRQQLKKID